MTTLESLQRENEMLVARQERLRRMVTSWGMDSQDSQVMPHRHLGGEVGMPCVSSVNGVDVPSLNSTPTVVQGQDMNLDYYGEVEALSTSDKISGSFHLPPLPTFLSAETVPSTVPTWCLTPMNEYGHDPSLIPATCPWLARSDLIVACPPEPSPLDLLYGTRRNFLADQIHRSIRHSIRDPECLASGWLVYLFSKWRVSPNPATFERLPSFYRPLMTQIHKGHPSALDLMIWPRLRMNLVENWAKYDFVELIGYLSCCTKIRWEWGKDVLERDSDDNLQIRSEFFDVFTRESGWGLTSEFIEKYPKLMDGMDIEAVRVRLDIPSS
jgi:hypothetical protein